jgi:hypothetical protein
MWPLDLLAGPALAASVPPFSLGHLKERLINAKTPQPRYSR